MKRRTHLMCALILRDVRCSRVVSLGDRTNFLYFVASLLLSLEIRSVWLHSESDLFARVMVPCDKLWLDTVHGGCSTRGAIDKH